MGCGICAVQRPQLNVYSVLDIIDTFKEKVPCLEKCGIGFLVVGVELWVICDTVKDVEGLPP